MEWLDRLKSLNQQVEQLENQIGPISMNQIALTAQEALDHLGIQIDAIRDVLVESGHVGLAQTKTIIEPEPVQEIEQEEVVPVQTSTPVKPAPPMGVMDSPTLADLGLSTLSLQILQRENDMMDSPRAPRIQAFRNSDDWSDRRNSSPQPPECVTRLSDPNNLFDALMEPINEEEYRSLAGFLTSQMTLNHLNDIVNGFSH